MGKKKTSSKQNARKKPLWLGIILGSILFIVLFSTLLFPSEKKSEVSPIQNASGTVPITQIPAEKENTSSTEMSYPTATPVVPTEPRNKYILIKSSDEIHLHPKSTAYAILATLVDENRNVIIDQSAFTYAWSIDNKDLVMEGYSSFSGCTQGIQPPCPDDHFSFNAIKSGKTVIRVKVTKGNELVAQTTFPLIIED